MSVVWCRRLIFDVCCLMLDVWCHMFDVRRLISDVTCIVSVVYCMMDLMPDAWCLVSDVCCLMSDICCLFQTSDISWLMSDVWCVIVRRQIIIIKIIIFITWYCANEHILKDQNANPKTWKANLFKYYYTAVYRLAALIVSGFKYYTIFCLLMFL